MARFTLPTTLIASVSALCASLAPRTSSMTSSTDACDYCRRDDMPLKDIVTNSSNKVRVCISYDKASNYCRPADAEPPEGPCFNCGDESSVKKWHRTKTGKQYFIACGTFNSVTSECKDKDDGKGSGKGTGRGISLTPAPVPPAPPPAPPASSSSTSLSSLSDVVKDMERMSNNMEFLHDEIKELKDDLTKVKDELRSSKRRRSD